MSFDISKSGLESAVNIMANVPARGGIISSEFVQISRHSSDTIKMTLSADVNASILLRGNGKVPFEKSVFLDRRMLFPFVNAGKEMQSDTYKMHLSDHKHVVLKHGSRHATFHSNSKASGYQDAPKITGHSFPLDNSWVSVVICAKLCAADDPVTPSMNCVYICKKSKKLQVLSTNGRLLFRGIIEEGKVGAPVEPVAFPLALITALETENVGMLKWNKRIALLEFPAGKVWQTVKSEARRNFPQKDVNALIDKAREGELLLTLGTNSLAESVGRIAVYLASVTREDLVLTMSAEKGKNVLHLKSGISGSAFDETVKLTTAPKDDIEIEWPLAAVLPILEYCKKAGEAKIYRDAKGRSLFSSGSISVLIGRRSKK